MNIAGSMMDGNEAVPRRQHDSSVVNKLENGPKRVDKGDDGLRASWRQQQQQPPHRAPSLLRTSRLHPRHRTDEGLMNKTNVRKVVILSSPLKQQQPSPISSILRMQRHEFVTTTVGKASRENSLESAYSGSNSLMISTSSGGAPEDDDVSVTTASTPSNTLSHEPDPSSSSINTYDASTNKQHAAHELMLHHPQEELDGLLSDNSDSARVAVVPQQNNAPRQQRRRTLVDSSNLFDYHFDDHDNHDTAFISRSTRTLTKSKLFTGDIEEKLSRDTFSFLISAPVRSVPFWTGIVILALKLGVYYLIVANLITGSASNPFGIPAAVPVAVSITQIIAMFITVITQDDLLTSTHYLIGGYHAASLEQAFPNASRTKFHISAAIQCVAGLLGLVVTFLLVNVSSNVIDLILNFTAIEFITFLDNAAFVFCSLGFAGRDNQYETKRIRSQWYTVPRTTRFSKLLQIILISITFLLLLAGWAVTYARQVNGVYLPQTLVVQFDDTVRPSLGAYSGKYILQQQRAGLSSINGHKRIMYRETTKASRFDIVSDDEKIKLDNGGIIAYCVESGTWTFRVGGDDPCASDAVVAQSAPTTSFDVTKSTLEQTWLVAAPMNSLISRFFQMKSFVLATICNSDNDCGTDKRGKCINNECICKDGFYGLRCRYQEQNTCSKLEVDLDRGQFESVRAVSANFRPVMGDDGRPVLTYQHPVYITRDGRKPFQDRDILIYTGVRWILTQINALKGNFEKGINQTATGDLLLQKFFRSFHAATSLQRIEFITQQVPFADPLDEASPININWFDGRNQPLATVEASVASEALLFCGICSNTTNPCRNGNLCQANGICDCKDGSLGTLCQTPPVSNGRCDSVFNIASFGYDGGDCCEATCEDAENEDTNSVCGRREKGGNLLDVGYPLCANSDFRCVTDDDDDETCFLPNGQDVDVPQGADMMLSANGRILVVLSSRLNTVVVYDKVDARWIQRGSAIEGNGDLNFGKAFALWTPPGKVRRRNDSELLPVVLAVGSMTDFGVFRWVNGDFEWSQVGSRIDLSFLIPVGESDEPVRADSVDIQLGLKGNVLSVMVGAVFEEPVRKSFYPFQRYLLRNSLRAASVTSWQEAMNVPAFVPPGDVNPLNLSRCPPCARIALHEATLSADGQSIAQSLLLFFRGFDSEQTSTVVAYRMDRNSVVSNKFVEILPNGVLDPSGATVDLRLWRVRLSLSRDGSRLSKVMLSKSRGFIAETINFATGHVTSASIFTNDRVSTRSNVVEETQLSARFHPVDEGLYVKKLEPDGVLVVTTYDFDALLGWKRVGAFELPRQQSVFDVSSGGNFFAVKQAASKVSSRHVSCPIDHTLVTMVFNVKDVRSDVLSWHVDQVQVVSGVPIRGRPLRVCKNCYSDAENSIVVEELCLRPFDLQCLRVMIDLTGYGSTQEAPDVTVLLNGNNVPPATGFTVDKKLEYNVGDISKEECQVRNNDDAGALIERGCEDGFDSVVIGVQLDNRPEENGWVLRSESRNETYLRVEKYSRDDLLSTPLHHICVPSNECLLLELTDNGGNGICCLPGSPFEVLVNGERVVLGDIYGFVNGTTYVGRFGLGCGVTNSPSASPSVSFAPTLSASPTLTSAPSGTLVCDGTSESILRLRFDVPNGASDALRFSVLDRSKQELLSHTDDLPLSKQTDQLWQLCIPQDECFILNVAGGIGDLQYFISVDDGMELNGSSTPVEKEIRFGPGCEANPFPNNFDSAECDPDTESLVEGEFTFDSRPTELEFRVMDANATDKIFVDLGGDDFRGFSDSTQVFQVCVPNDSCLQMDHEFLLSDVNRGGTFEIFYNGISQFSSQDFVTRRRLQVTRVEKQFPRENCDE